MKQKLILGLVALLFLGFAILMSIKSAKPPQPHEHEGGNILTAKLGEVDPANAAVLTLKIKELDCQGAADTIAGALIKLGSIGEVKVDLNKRTFSLVYDKTKLKKEDIIKAIKAVDFSPEVVQE